jgi:hypothetical protein
MRRQLFMRLRVRPMLGLGIIHCIPLCRCAVIVGPLELEIGLH